ncbi:hypothetical protein LMZ02_29470 [Paenibacillus macerans]|nr:hypothetical protein [Paenibacillus macerans]UMV47508.1 hypothetical protein LMZ02_29470 [Paenibacillus macerans]
MEKEKTPLKNIEAKKVAIPEVTVNLREIGEIYAAIFPVARKTTKF